MTKSQNGWAVVGPGAMDEDPIWGSVHVPNGVLKGPVAVVFRWLARQYAVRVETLHIGWCWGYDVKKIQGSDEYSNHASGTAVDFNAPEHNQGQPASHSMSQHQIDECHAIERESDGVLRWGGDFSRPDPMHWEIIGTPTQVAAFARKIALVSHETDLIMSELPTLKIGASGTPVKRVQSLANLTLGGGDVAVDGDFGSKTTAIVKRVQAAGHLPKTGVVDAKTWAVLLGVKP